MIGVMRGSIQSAAIGASYITAVRAKPTDRAGQNEAEYQRMVAAITADPTAAAFVALVEGIGHASAFVVANQCARYWTPGSVANVTLCFHLRHPDGSNAFSYAGTGTDVADAIAKATAALERFTIDKIGDVLAWLARGRRWGGWRSLQRDFG